MLALNVRRVPLLAACILVSAVILTAACGGDVDGGSTGEGATPTPQATPSPTRGEPTPRPSVEPADTIAPVELRDFSVAPAVTRANPGTITFQVTNAGAVRHEFLVIKSDLHIADLPVDGEEGVIEDEVDIVGRIEPLQPGESGEVAVPLEEAKYVLICNLNDGGESHYLNGMYVQFTVAPLPGGPPVATQVPTQ